MGKKQKKIESFLTAKVYECEHKDYLGRSAIVADSKGNLKCCMCGKVIQERILPEYSIPATSLADRANALDPKPLISRFARNHVWDKYCKIKDLFVDRGWDTDKEFDKMVKDLHLTIDDYKLDLATDEAGRPTRDIVFAEDHPYASITFDYLEYGQFLDVMRRRAKICPFVALYAVKNDNGLYYIHTTAVSDTDIIRNDAKPNLDTHMIGYFVIRDYSTNGIVYPNDLFKRGKKNGEKNKD